MRFSFTISLVLFQSLISSSEGFNIYGRRHVVHHVSKRADLPCHSTQYTATTSSCTSFFQLAAVDDDVSLEQKYSAMTVAELKDVLRTRNLPLGGLKKDLLQRVLFSPVEDEGSLKKLKYQQDSSAITSSKNSLLDFDDSVFDRIPSAKGGRGPTSVAGGRGAEVRGGDEGIGDGIDDGGAGRSAPPDISRGSSIKARIVSYGPLGASVRITPSGSGLILRHEIELYETTHGAAPEIDEVVDAWVLKVREDGKVDVSLRPVGYNKVLLARDELLARLESPDCKDGVLLLGDRSTPEEIASIFPGMSKGQYKTGVGALLREGAIVITESSITLVPANKRVAMAAEPYSGKSPRGWRPPEGCTVFVGNLPFELTSMELARAFEKRIGFGLLASVRIATDPDSGRSRGFGHVDFFTVESAKEAMGKINGLRVDGRDIRVEETKRAEERPAFPKEPRDWGESSAYGRQSPSKLGAAGGADGQDNWCTVFVGGLPYSCTEDTLKYLVESS